MQHFTPTAETATALPLIATRGSWGEIIRLTKADGTTFSPATVVSQFKAALPDEFASFDRKNRGAAMSLDLYGYDPAQNVAVVQIRNTVVRYRNGWRDTRKTYVLVGRNENGNPFRHPISHAPLHAAIRKENADSVAVVRAAQCWMWEVSTAKLAKGIRQGDWLMVPIKRLPPNVQRISATVADEGTSHEIRAMEFAKGPKGTTFAKGPTMLHTKGQHLPVYGDNDGWHSIHAAREAAAWDFGKRISD